MQKFVTIYVDGYTPFKQKLHKEPMDSPSRVVEHLQTYLEEEWEVVTLQAFGDHEAGFFGVVLEKRSG